MTLIPVLSDAIKQPWDYVSNTSAATTDTFVFKVGGASGKTIATIVVTYTDSTKSVLSSVSRS